MQLVATRDETGTERLCKCGCGRKLPDGSTDRREYYSVKCRKTAMNKRKVESGTSFRDRRRHMLSHGIAIHSCYAPAPRTPFTNEADFFNNTMDWAEDFVASLQFVREG